MTWQEVVGVNQDDGSLILCNADGKEYEVPLLSRIEALLEEDELHVDINPKPHFWDLPEACPPLIDGWHSGDWETNDDGGDEGDGSP